MVTTISFSSSTGTGDFLDASNWTPMVMPGPGVFAIIGGEPTLDNATINGFTVDIPPAAPDTAVLDLDDATLGSTMVVEDTGNTGGASLQIDGQVVNDGTILLNANIGGEFNGFTFTFMANSDTLTNNGLISIGANDGLFVGNGSGGIVLNNGTIEVASERIFQSGPSYIDGAGTIVAENTTLEIGTLYQNTLSYAFGDRNSTIEFDPRFAVGVGGNEGTVDNFYAGDTIYFYDDDYVTGSGTYDAAHRTVTVGTNNGTFTFQLNGTADYANTISVVQSANGFTLTTTVACFAAGTRVLAASGPRAVELLQPGDQVATAAGGWRTVIWTGQRRVACRQAREPDAVQPVRIAAHAFGPGVPARDLFLSPDHGVFAGGVLIPAGLLVNGATVLREDVEAVTYWHVELDRHDVLLADGLPCESYLDTGNRAEFANAAPRPVAPAGSTVACAPLVRSGPVLDKVRAMLQVRGAAPDREARAA